MKKAEMELFLDLCKPENTVDEEVKDSISLTASPEVLGQLFFNRMAGVAYTVLLKNNLLREVNREFRTSLQNAYLQNTFKNSSFYKCVDRVSKILSGIDYVMLKGAVLCATYPKGCRTSNDIDILVSPDDINIVDYALRSNGFLQGSVSNDIFIPATRREIIGSRMSRGETVPYIKEVGLPFMKHLEVDVNFSLDYKNSSPGILKKMISNGVFKELHDSKFRTLDEIDFFIHLCCHLYKEATTMPWIKMRRDMTLYKYCDIFLLLRTFDEKAVNAVFDRADEYELDDVCAAVIKWTTEIFGIGSSYAEAVADSRLELDKTILRRVISPSDNKTFLYTEKNARKRFFADNRVRLLKEEADNEKTANV